MSEIRIVLLGTSGSTPTKDRGMPSAAIVYNGDIFLFDCGEGTQMQMLKFGLNISKVKAIFVTHAHGDHVIGIAGLVRTLTLNGREEKLQIFIPEGQEHIIAKLVSFDKAIINYPVVVEGIKGGDVYKGDNFRVSAVKLKHSIKSYGYIFKEDDKLRFVKEKANAVGLKGRMFAEIIKKKKIKIGKKTIRLKDITWLQRGKKVAYITDTKATKSIVPAIKDADLLIHESMYIRKERKLALERSHSTAYGAAEVAKLANVKRLVLFHISPRYRDTKAILDEARSVFSGAEIGKDGYNIYI